MRKEPLKKDDPEHYVATDVYRTLDLEADGEDPYNSTLDAQRKPKRRSLDDMRRLSETIKATRSQK